jgi:hypothetical protein
LVFLSDFWNNILHALFISSVSVAFPSVLSVLLDLITPIIFGEKYELWSSSLDSFYKHIKTRSSGKN